MKRTIMTHDPEWEQTYANRWRIRPYTDSERDFLEQDHEVSTVHRLMQIVMRIKIDNERFAQGATERPAMAPHFDRLIDIGRQSIEGWMQHYEHEHAISLPVVVPYDGSEDLQSIITSRPQHEPTSQFRAQLIA